MTDPVSLQPLEERQRSFVRDEAKDVLERFLAKLETGEVDEVMVIANSVKNANVEYGFSGTLTRMQRIGMLEYLKFRELDRFAEGIDY